MEVEFIPYQNIMGFADNSFFIDYINKKNIHLYKNDYSEKSIASIIPGEPLSVNLGEKIKKYNEDFITDSSTVTAIDSLCRKGTGAVITGQQPHIYASPLYTIYKILTAIITAENLTKKYNRLFIPVFWNGSDDHDLGEMNKAVFPGISQGMESFRLDLEHQGIPIYSYPVEEEFKKVNALLFSALKETEFSHSVRDIFSTNIQSIPSQMTFAVKKLFLNQGLVVLEPRLLRSDCSAIYRQIALNDREINKAIKEAGYKTGEFLTRDNSSNLFFHGNEKREKVLFQDDCVELNGKKMSIKEYADYVSQNPEQFSPNAAVRPIVQDSILPAVCYIGGPGECNYFSQLSGIYDILGVRMPAIKPRVSATLLTPREARMIEKFSFMITDILNGDIVLPDDKELEADKEMVDKFAQNIFNEIELFSQNAGKISAEIKESLNAPIRKIEFEIDKIKEKFIKGCEKSRGIQRGQISRLKDSVLPGNVLQERVFTPAYYINNYGEKLINKLKETFNTEINEHHVIFLD